MFLCLICAKPHLCLRLIRANTSICLHPTPRLSHCACLSYSICRRLLFKAVHSDWGDNMIDVFFGGSISVRCCCVFVHADCWPAFWSSRYSGRGKWSQKGQEVWSRSSRCVFVWFLWLARTSVPVCSVLRFHTNVHACFPFCVCLRCFILKGGLWSVYKVWVNNCMVWD